MILSEYENGDQCPLTEGHTVTCRRFDEGPVAKDGIMDRLTPHGAERLN
jgi:hypothetical protein